MCNEAVEFDPSSLRFVSDCFVTQQQLKLWHHSDDWLLGGGTMIGLLNGMMVIKNESLRKHKYRKS